MKKTKLSHIYNFLKNIKSKLINKDNSIIGIDLGTTYTLMCVNNKGIVLNESSTISYINDNNILSNFLYGNEAKDLIGKTPLRIEVVNPLEDGVICDGNMSEQMIVHFLNQIIGKQLLFNPIIIAGVPIGATNVEKKAIQEILERCNTKEVFLCYESVLAAIGSGLPIDKPIGSMVIDIGGGTTEISIISLGGVIKTRSFKYGGRKIDKAIIEYLINKHNVIIGENTAEYVKKQIGTLFVKKDDDIKSITIQCRNLTTHVPQDIVISQNDMQVALAEFTNLLVDNTKQVLESAPPEIMKDILKNGCYLCGGGANLQNIDFIFEKLLNITAHKIEKPELAVIKGLQEILKDYKTYDYVLFKQIQ